MRMKKLLVIIILLGLVVPSVKATGQSGDIIRLEGEEWVLIIWIRNLVHHGARKL